MADIQIRGLPADEHHVLTIGENRTISIPPLFQGADDLRSASACILCFQGKVLFLCWSECLHVPTCPACGSRCQLASGFYARLILLCTCEYCSVCLELRHQKSDKVSTRAWTYLELNNIKNGERRLQLYSKPVQVGVKSPKTSPLKVFFIRSSTKFSQGGREGGWRVEGGGWGLGGGLGCVWGGVGRE
jgi:hypothetical protein